MVSGTSMFICEERTIVSLPPKTRDPSNVTVSPAVQESIIALSVPVPELATLVTVHVVANAEELIAKKQNNVKIRVRKSRRIICEFNPVQR